MNTYNYILILVFFFGLISCENENKTEINNDQTTQSITSDLKVDHFNIWVKDPATAKKKLTDIGFASVPDSLSKIHIGQGTAGRYFHFLNGYLELIFVYDQSELEENNHKNKNLDFTTRANFDTNGASPLSIALKVKDYNIERIPFEKVRYHQDWMEDNASIYAAKNSKMNPKEPSVFVVYPEIESGTFESLTELEHYPSEDSSWKAFFKHKNGAQKITNVIITSNDLNLNTETIKALNGIENLTVKNGKAHVMELHFDNGIQGKSFDLRPELPLIIHL